MTKTTAATVAPGGKGARVPRPPVVKTRKQAEAALAKIGEYSRTLAALKLELDTSKAALVAAYETGAAPLRVAAAQAVEALQSWCDANRADLLTGKGKTATLASGVIGWKKAPDRVELDGELDELLQALKDRGLYRFIRKREEPDLEAMKKEPDEAERVKGVTIVKGGDTFFAKPVGSTP